MRITRRYVRIDCDFVRIRQCYVRIDYTYVREMKITVHAPFAFSLHSDYK